MRLVARPIAGGHGEGTVLAAAAPLSLLGGVDRETGRILDPATGLQGEGVADRVLAFPRGKGSTAGSYVLYALQSRGLAPAALVAGRAEAVVATGAILSEIPMVDGVPSDLFRTGDRATVDADQGFVDLHGVEARHVVTSFLLHGDRVLLLKRSQEVGSFQGHWAGVSGYLEGDEDPLERARAEIQEETGVPDAVHRATGAVVLARGRTGDVIWAVHPFLFEVETPDVTLDWEHETCRWVPPEAVGDYETVPKLRDALQSALAGLRRPDESR